MSQKVPSNFVSNLQIIETKTLNNTNFFKRLDLFLKK